MMVCSSSAMLRPIIVPPMSWLRAC
jgi:hypothetical protein